MRAIFPKSINISYVRMFPVLQLIDVTTELRHGVIVLLGRPSSRSKNGFFYVLDAKTGKLLSAKPWSKLPGPLPTILRPECPCLRAAETIPTNGGILSTAGNLVFQGQGTGEFAAYAADSGKKVWSIHSRNLCRQRRAVRADTRWMGLWLTTVCARLDHGDSAVETGTDTAFGL